MLQKEQERAELHRSIWQISNTLRGSIDGWDFKQYIFGMLFYRFISENIARIDQSFTDSTDEEWEQVAKGQIIAQKGLYIAPSQLFCNVLKNAKNNSNLNEDLAKIFKNIELSAVGTESENDVKGLFSDLDVNSPKLGNSVSQKNEKLVQVLEAIGALKLGNYEDNTIDAFGDAYEYLMQMYAANAGKSGGEYFTPQEVSELLARITTVGKDKVRTVYDPCCGSGSLLLKFAKVLGKDNVTDCYYGQELNHTTYNLCRINMFLHNIRYNQFDIKNGDTLREPLHTDKKPFDVIVSNPPYSVKWEGDANPLLINDERFNPAGVLAPKSKADLAFVMHIISHLAEDGTAAIVEFPGVLYRGGAEQKIRKYLIDNNFVDTIIQLPSDLFLEHQLLPVL